MFPSFSSDSKVTFIFQQYSFDINSFISSCLIPSTFKTQNNCFLFPLPYISSLHHSASNVCSVCTTSPLLIISNAHFDKSNSIFISGEKTLTICTKLSSCSSFLAMIFTLPPLGLFLGIYFTTDNLVLGAVIGFGAHFVILAFSSKISKFLTKLMS